MKSVKNIKRANKTRRNKNSSLGIFQKEITVVFLEMLMIVKLFHWKTHSYSAHKASDELYDKLNGHIDGFIEILLGKTGSRIDLMNTKNIKIMNLKSNDEIKQQVEIFKNYLFDLEDNKGFKSMKNNDLLTIRDEIIGDLNQFLYLLTFK